MNIHCYIRTIAVITGFLSAFAGCGKGICMQGSGAITTETRAVTGIGEIHLYNRINLILTQDSTETIQVEAGKHLLAGIETSIENGVLTIKDNNTCNWVRDPDNRVNVYAHVKNLQQLIYHGSGNISSSNTLTGENLVFDSHEGTGSLHVTVQADECSVVIRKNNADFTLEGQTTGVFLYCADQGKVDLGKLSCARAFIDHRSIYDAYINCRETLDGFIWYKGHVYLRGNPGHSDVKTYNTGRLIQLP